jgi:hypothetical protein
VSAHTHLRLLVGGSESAGRGAAPPVLRVVGRAETLEPDRRATGGLPPLPAFLARAEAVLRETAEPPRPHLRLVDAG